MNKEWNEIRWIFEPDGALRDIYVQDISISDWVLFIDFLNQNYPIQYGPTDQKNIGNQIDKDYIILFLTDNTGELECKSATIDLDGIKVNCHFFLADQIELDIDPKDINSIEDYTKIIGLMEKISQSLKNQVTLTDESRPEFPLIKVDSSKGLVKALTIEEFKDISALPNRLRNKISLIKTNLKMKLFPKKYMGQLLEIGSEPYISTKKDKNIW